MAEETRSIRLPIMVSKTEVEAIDEFRVTERLASRAETIRLLIEIGLDAVSKGAGKRFWDRKPDEPGEP